MKGRHQKQEPSDRPSGALFDSYSAFKKAAANWYKPPYAYGIFGTDTVQAFEQEMMNREGAQFAVAFPSGMAAIAATFISLSAKRDRKILVQDDIYTVGKMFCDRILESFGIETHYCAPEKLTPDDLVNASLLYLENPSYKHYQSIDLAAVIARAKAAGVPSVVDNSLMTYIHQKPLEMGADVVLYSASKHVAGHGDVLLGVVMTNDEATYRKIRDTQILLGMAVSSSDCALALRGLETLEMRLEQECDTTASLIEDMAQWPWVERIEATHVSVENGTVKAHTQPHADMPALPLFSMRLKGTYDESALETMSQAFQTIKIGYGWGATQSIILPEIDENGVVTMRLAVGIEGQARIAKDLQSGYQALSTHQAPKASLRP
jgi:cystathionine beta-lyase